MRSRPTTVVLSVAVVCVVATIGPGILRADSVQPDLEGRRVVVTTNNGTVVRGWLIRVGPKVLLIGCDNNTFVRIRRRIITSVHRAGSAPRPHRAEARARGSRHTDSAPISARSRPKQSAEAFWAKKRMAGASVLRKAGIGVTVTGMALFVTGWLGGMLIQGVGYFGFIYGGLAVGSGAAGTFLAVGSPIWTVGSVRYSIASAGQHWKAKRRAWIHRGIAVTSSGAGLAILGSAMFGAFLGSDHMSGRVLVSGAVFMAVGFFTAIFVGVPMWATAALYSVETPKSHATPTALRKIPHRRFQPFDPIHEAQMHSRLLLGFPRPTLFSTQLRF